MIRELVIKILKQYVNSDTGIPAYKTMNIIGIEDYDEVDDEDERSFKELDRDLIYSIVAETETEPLEEALKIDVADWLPTTTKIILLRRLVELERSEKNLRQLANHLYYGGPIWDEEAKKLLDEADRLQNEKSTDDD